MGPTPLRTIRVFSVILPIVVIINRITTTLNTPLYHHPHKPRGRKASDISHPPDARTIGHGPPRNLHSTNASHVALHSTTITLSRDSPTIQAKSDPPNPTPTPAKMTPPERHITSTNTFHSTPQYATRTRTTAEASIKTPPIKVGTSTRKPNKCTLYPTHNPQPSANPHTAVPCQVRRGQLDEPSRPTKDTTSPPRRHTLPPMKPQKNTTTATIYDTPQRVNTTNPRTRIVAYSTPQYNIFNHTPERRREQPLPATAPPNPRPR